MSVSGIQLGAGVSIGTGIELGIPPVLKLSLDASTYTANPTGAQQNVSGSSDTIGFFPYGWNNPPPSGFGNVMIGWTVVGHPDWVVTAVDSVAHVITITGGTFTSGDSYQFTNEYTWFDTVANRPFLLQNGVTYDYPSNGGSFVFAPAAQQYAQSSTSLATLNTWTVEAWHYYDGTNAGASPCIVTEVFPGTTSNINYALGSLNDNSPNLQSGFYRGGWTETPTGYALTPGNWYQIVGTYDGQSSKLYVNNTLVESALGSAAPLSSNGGINLMRRWDYTEFWGGKLAIVKIYDGAISAAEVNASWLANRNRFGLAPPTFGTPTIMNSGAFVSLLQTNGAAIDSSGLITVIGSNSGNFGSAVSSDGTTWTGPAQEITGSTSIIRVVWSSYHNYFLAVGIGASSYPIYTTSTDGINWDTPAVINAITIGNVYALAVNSSGVFAAIMIPNPGGYPMYTTSADGTTWTTPTTIPGADNGVYYFNASITVNPAGNFVVAGYNSFNSTPWYTFSADGSTWAALQTGSNFLPKSLTWSNYHNLFVTIGNTGSGLAYSTSTNGTTWTSPVSIAGTTDLMQIFSLKENPSGVLVGVGQIQVGGTGQPIYLTSTNATDWSVPTSFNGSTSIGYMRNILYSASLGKFVAIGFDSGTNWIYSVST